MLKLFINETCFQQVMLRDKGMYTKGKKRADKNLRMYMKYINKDKCMWGIIYVKKLNSSDSNVIHIYSIPSQSLLPSPL